MYGSVEHLNFVFLQVTSRKDQEQYWMDKRKPYRYVPVKKFAEEFQKFHVGTNIKDELAEPYPKEKSHPAALIKEKYTISKLELFRVTFEREVVLMKRNSIVAIVNVVEVYTSDKLDHHLHRNDLCRSIHPVH